LEDSKAIGISAKPVHCLHKMLEQIEHLGYYELKEDDNPLQLIDQETFFTIIVQRLMVERHSRAIKGIKKRKFHLMVRSILKY